jgi:SOS response regulatory protein OraA/RecX
MSRRAVLAALAEKGVARELAQEVVGAYETEHPGCFLQALEAQLLAAGVLGEDGALREGVSREERDRVTRRMMRRGFSYRDLKEFFP